MFKSMADIKAANKASGNYWFDRDTLRFWGSRVETRVLRGRYFITSEDSFDRSCRLYTIRRADDDGSIDTIGSFQAYRSLELAKDALAAHLA